MSEKRFIIFREANNIFQLYDNKTNCFYPIHDNERNVDLLCERLNELSDENKKLQTTVKRQDIIIQTQNLEIGMKETEVINEQKKVEMQANIMSELNDENEQLRKENDLKSDFMNFIIEDIQKLKEENNILKAKLKDIYELTEQTGMIHLRKEQIRQVIAR